MLSYLVHGTGPGSVELDAENFDAFIFLGCKIERLVRICGKVVELGFAGFVLRRGNDEFPTVG